MKPSRKPWLALLFGAVTALIADQVLLHTALADGEFLGHDLAPFSPPLYGKGQRQLLVEFEEKLTWPPERFEADSLFDAELGWCPSPGQVRRTERYDWSGSRIAHAPLPTEHESGGKRIALFGCSYTYGSEVAATESWAAQLNERHPELYIANLGVPGFGVDQALLRFRRDGIPLGADEVWLGYFPGAAVRVTSRFPPLFSRWRSLTVNFKPCFELDEEGELRLLPCPAHEPADIARLLRNPHEFLAAMGGRDIWIQRSPWSYLPKGEHWSHAFGFGRLALTLHERMGRESAEHLRNREAPIYPLNLALLQRFAHEVAASGARFRLSILPSIDEVDAIARHGVGFWDPLVTDLRAAGIEVHDVARDLHELGVVAGPEHWMPEGHYSPRCNELVAEVLERAWLQTE